MPVGFLALNASYQHKSENIIASRVQLVRDMIGAVASFKIATVVPRLPKTRSGKILRGTMKKIADGEIYETPATIEDPIALSEITEALSSIGYPSAP